MSAPAACVWSSRSKAGAQHPIRPPRRRAQREDRGQALVDPRGEHGVRHPRAGSGQRADRGSSSRRLRAARSGSTTSSIRITSKSPAPIRSNTAPRYLDWADRALPPFQEAFLAKGAAHGVLRHGRPQRLPAGAQQDLLASAAAGRRRPEHGQLPQPADFQRSGGVGGRAQPALVSDPELCARHGQREHA